MPLLCSVACPSLVAGFTGFWRWRVVLVGCGRLYVRPDAHTGSTSSANGGVSRCVRVRGRRNAGRGGGPRRAGRHHPDRGRPLRGATADRHPGRHGARRGPQRHRHRRRGHPALRRRRHRRRRSGGEPHRHRHTFYGVLFTGLHDENGPSAHDGRRTTSRGIPQKFPPLQRFRVDHVTAYNNGLYGIYAFNAQHGVITDSYASGSADSGFYVGQCTRLRHPGHRQRRRAQRGRLRERQRLGLRGDRRQPVLRQPGRPDPAVHYQEAFPPSRRTRSSGNLISDNGQADSPAQADGGFGTGLGIGGGQSNTVARNRITGHQRAGIVLTNTEDLPALATRSQRQRLRRQRVDLANGSAPTGRRRWETAPPMCAPLTRRPASPAAGGMLQGQHGRGNRRRVRWRARRRRRA